MRAALSLLGLTLCALALYLAERSPERLPDSGRDAMRWDLRLLSQASPAQGPCVLGRRRALPGLLLGSQSWPAPRRELGGLVAGRIDARGRFEGFQAYDLGPEADWEASLAAFEAWLEATPASAHLALLAQGALGEVQAAREPLGRLLERLGAREAPIDETEGGALKAPAWCLVTQRLGAAGWQALAELSEPEDCAELWCSLAP